MAEVLTAKGWEQCGGTPTSYPSAMALSCALLGTAVRIRADRTTALTLAEIEVFAEARMPFFLVHVWHGGALRCGGGGGGTGGSYPGVSACKVPTYSTRTGAAPRAPGGARHRGGNRAVTSQPRMGQSTLYGDVKSSYGGAGGWDRRGCATWAPSSATRQGEEQPP